MIRIEIIANHSVEENILEALSKENAGKFYTRYSGVYGAGRQGPRMGDAVWPEENFVLVIWCEADEAEAIERAVASVKKVFPDEGIKLFGLPDPAALQLPSPGGGIGNAVSPPRGETETSPEAEISPRAEASPPPAFGGETF